MGSYRVYDHAGRVVGLFPVAVVNARGSSEGTMKRYLIPFLIAFTVFGVGFVLLDYLSLSLQGLTLIFEG